MCSNGCYLLSILLKMAWTYFVLLFQKLNAIAKLKGELENGKTLEKDQLEKISTEEKLIKDLEELII